MAEEIEVLTFVEEVWGVVQCFTPDCSYRGRMDGFIQPENDKFIQFICPECKGVERVRNPDAL